MQQSPSNQWWNAAFSLCVVTILTLASWPVRAAEGPKLPFPDPGACPFECCQYGPWTASVAQTAYISSCKAARVAFKVRPGEPIEALTGIVITRKSGVVIVHERRNFGDVTVPAGGRLFVLHQKGEGEALFWYEGAVHTAELYADTVHKGNTNYPWDVVSVPQTEWWVKVKNRRGETGWLLNPHDFHGMDACGN